MKYYSIGEFSNRIGKSIQTLRNWDKNGSFKPAYVTSGKTRYYSQEQLDNFLGIRKSNEKKALGYCRIERVWMKEHLEKQFYILKKYMKDKGYDVEIIIDIDGFDEDEASGLNKIINRIIKGEVSKIIIFSREEITGVVYSLLENICINYSVKIEFVNEKNEIKKKGEVDV